LVLSLVHFMKDMEKHYSVHPGRKKDSKKSINNWILYIIDRS
jgi:hypothetical protein